jgi:homoserine kinase type II
MAILTPLPLEHARTIGALYGLNVAAVRGILAGSVNSNYELMLSGGGRAFLRIYEEQNSQAAAGEAAVLDHLSAGGVSTPRPLRLVAGGRAGQLEAEPSPAFITEHAGKAVAIFPWAPGEVVCRNQLSTSHMTQVGQALARVHIAGASFPGAPANRFTAARLNRRLAGLSERSLPGELARDVSALRRSLDRCIAAQTEQPADGLIHGDLFRDNVLWEDGKITALLDFESASRGSFPFDLMVVVLSWTYGDSFNPELARSFVAGYATIRPISGNERTRLFDDACFAALRFAITRITDYELRPRGRGEYRDYRRFLARLSEVERLGSGGLAALLGL